MYKNVVLAGNTADHQATFATEKAVRGEHGREGAEDETPPEPVPPRRAEVAGGALPLYDAGAAAQYLSTSTPLQSATRSSYSGHERMPSSRSAACRFSTGPASVLSR
jgi:hypothetical protein